MSFVDILIAFGKGSIAVIGTIGSGIAKGSLSKIGANITETVSSKFVPSQDTDDLDDENRFYCPFCGTAIEHGRVVCLGCHAKVIYGKTQEEINREIVIYFSFGGFITYLFLDPIPKLLNSIFNWNIASRFGLTISWSLYLWLAIVFCLGILFIYREKKANQPQRIRCRLYCDDTEKYIYKDVEYKTIK